MVFVVEPSKRSPDLRRWSVSSWAGWLDAPLFQRKDVLGKQYLVKKAIAFGTPPSSRITKLDGAEVGKVQDANRTGYLGTQKFDDKTRLTCVMSCDILDGVVTSFLIWHWKISRRNHLLESQAP